MGVYIKGMVMPSSCYECHLRQRNGMYIVCPVTHARFSVADVNILDCRLKICPLVPIPPHGRLIDADALISRCTDEKGCYYGYESAVIGKAAESASTVIEAEEAAE